VVVDGHRYLYLTKNTLGMGGIVFCFFDLG
jgi:hypothetical protein